MNLFNIFARYDLQLFGGEGGAGAASGGGDGGSSAGEGDAGVSSTVVSAPDDGDARLRELGVPEAALRKRAERRAKYGKANVQPLPAEQNSEKPAEQSAEKPDAAAENEPAPDNNGEKAAETKAPAKKPSFDELMADPEYNKAMQSVVQSRLKTAKAAEDQLAKLNPAIEVLARRYGMDAANMDFEALAKNIENDDKFYEDKALEMGVSVDTAKRIDQTERAEARRQREEAQNIEQQKIAQHLQRLQQQAEEMKKVFPGFDLSAELQNPVFFRMTSPNVGLSVEDAYYSVHRKEIQSAANAQIAQKTAEKISNSIRSGNVPPRENGTASVSPSVSTFDYAHASKEQRDAIKAQIRQAAARGEKIYPGDFRPR